MQERGFSLAAIRELLIEHGTGGSLARLLGPAEDSQWDDDLTRAVEKAFPDQGVAAPPIQNAAALGMILLDGSQVSVADKSSEPMVRAILRLFEMGLDEQDAMELWQTVVSHVSDIAERFSLIAKRDIYPRASRSSHADVAGRLVAAAEQVVSLALDMALEQTIRSDPDSVIS